MRARAISAAFAGVLALAACSDDGDDGAPPGGTGGGGANAAGSGGTGGSGGSAGAMNVAGSGGMGGTAGCLGTAGTGGAGGLGGAGGTGGSIVDSGTPDAEADAEAPGDTRPPANSIMVPSVMESGGVEPWFNVYRPMDLDTTGLPLPVIVWANGGCFRSDFTWAPLFERWAAAGFVVLALTESPTEGALGQTTVEHHGQLIDWALEQAEDADGIYAGKLDPDRIIAAGNSCGGITALGVASADDRVHAVFVLSGSSSAFGADTAVIDGISVPVGYVVGGSEDIAGANATADYDLLADGIPAMIVSRSSGDHMTVSTDAMILPQVAEIALSWMDLALYGTPESLEALKSATVCAGCEAGMWTLKAKNIETLAR